MQPTIYAPSSYQGRVVRKPINANPGLKVKRSIYFSCIKPFLLAYVLCTLSLVKFKLRDEQYKQKTSRKSYKTQIKILANPRLA